MEKQAILDRLRTYQPELRALGVTGAAWFGSRARGGARADSDTDIMVEIDPEAHVTLFDYVGIREYIAGLFDGKVDVVDREGIKPHWQPRVTADLVYAFRQSPNGSARYTG